MRAGHFVGIFFLSAATLLLELSLMRVLAVANWYHFGFFVISMALLAFGASGALLTVWTKLRDEVSLDQALSVLSVSFGLAAIVSYGLMQRIPFDPFQLLVDPTQLVFIPLYFVVAGVPFFFSGLAIGLLLSRGGSQIGRLYAADLVGAGVGCGLLVVVMPLVGGAGSIVVAALLGFLGACVFGYRTARHTSLVALALAVVAVPLAARIDEVTPISIVAGKRHPLQPVGATPIYTAWNAFSRVDVFDLPALPEEGRPDPGFSIIVDAGAAGTAIPDMSGGALDYLKRATAYHPTGIAYVGKPHPKVLVIGSGSGREVLEAIDHGARSVTAVEINPIINDIVTRHMRSEWGGLFEQPGVTLVTEDGRSFIRRSSDQYDAIISVQSMVDAAVTSGAMTMSESYLFTKEAFADYLDHLTPDGVLLITRPDPQIIKLFATIRDVFEERGLGDPAQHLFAFRGPLAPYGHALFNLGLLFKKSPWTADELETVTDRLGVGHPEQWFGRSPEVLYSPLTPITHSEDRYSGELEDVLTAPSLDKFYAAHREQFSPATDDRPFFNQNVRWVSLRPADFLQIFGTKKGNVAVQPVAEVMLLAMLFSATVIALILIAFPLIRFARHGLRISRPLSHLTYFLALGFGFIMIEIVLIQRSLLFLGQPVLAFAVVLAGLLVFTGLGSGLLGQLRVSGRRALLWIVPAILAVLFLMTTESSAIFAATLGLSLALRIAIVIAMLAPLGMLLGMPFPIGLRVVAEETPAFVPWAWGANGFATVLGSIGASILGMALGFTAVLAISGACYLAALLAMMWSNRRKPVDEALGVMLDASSSPGAQRL